MHKPCSNILRHLDFLNRGYASGNLPATLLWSVSGAGTAGTSRGLTLEDLFLDHSLREAAGAEAEDLILSLSLLISFAWEGFADNPSFASFISRLKMPFLRFRSLLY